MAFLLAVAACGGSGMDDPSAEPPPVGGPPAPSPSPSPAGPALAGCPMFPEENFDLSRFTGSSRIILTALQRYGMFLVDEAGDGFVAISGATDSRWDDHDLDQLKTVPFSAFEVVQLPPVHSP